MRTIPAAAAWSSVLDRDHVRANVTVPVNDLEAIQTEVRALAALLDERGDAALAETVRGHIEFPLDGLLIRNLDADA